MKRTVGLTLILMVYSGFVAMEAEESKIICNQDFIKRRLNSLNIGLVINASKKPVNFEASKKEMYINCKKQLKAWKKDVKEDCGHCQNHQELLKTYNQYKDTVDLSLHYKNKSSKIQELLDANQPKGFDYECLPPIRHIFTCEPQIKAIQKNLESEKQKLNGSSLSYMEKQRINVKLRQLERDLNLATKRKEIQLKIIEKNGLCNGILNCNIH